MEHKEINRGAIRDFIFDVSTLRESLFNLRHEGVKKGEWTGFESLFDKYSMKRGSTTYIYAGAHTGKSQFTFELIINLAQYSGWKWAIYSPETGSPTDLYAELLWVYLRKPFLVNDRVTASEEEADKAIDFISKHFFVVDSGLKDLSIEGFYTAVEEIESRYQTKIDGCVIDPFTEIKTDISSGVRDDIAIGQVLTRIRKHSSERDYHTIVTVHTKHQQPKYKNGIPYVDVPTMNDIAGGMQWSRKGMMIINVWRCPYGLEDENGIPYEPNQVKITVVKAKPKIVGSLGSIYLYYDRMANRYYEAGENGKKIYAYPQPSSDF
jgi:twinkle protein